MDVRAILVRAVVTAVEAVLAVLLSAGLTDLDATGVQTALVTGIAAGLSAAYNALRQWLDNQGVTPGV
ncbi:MAG TPA: hypothetical protein VKZ72_07845 [Acidimicrobiales bacterium]|nr:hypothetical protein [Acidimicrobiales bacterium]